MSIKLSDLTINEKYNFTVIATTAGNPVQFKDAKLLSIMNNNVANATTDTSVLLNRLKNTSTALPLVNVKPETATYYMFEVDSSADGMVLVPSYIIDLSSLSKASQTIYSFKLALTDPAELISIELFLKQNNFPYTLVKED